MRRPAVAALVALGAMVGLFFAFQPSGDGGGGGGGGGSVRVGRPAPKFETFDLAGAPVSLESVKTPVLLNFWASWCTPCREEFPMLARVHGRGATVLGVVFRDSDESARGFMREQRAEWPGLIDPEHQISDAYDVHPKPGIPVTYAIDAGGIVRAKHLGPLTQSDLDRLLTLIRA